MSRARGRGLSLGGVVASCTTLSGLLLLWWWVTHRQWISPVFLPSPGATWEALREGLQHGDLEAYTWATVQRMFLGWGLASVLGIGLGALLGLSASARAWMSSTLEFFRPLPASAILPLSISLFGLSAGMVLAVVAFGSMWPVLLATMQGIAGVHPRLREVGQSLEFGRAEFAWKVGLPNALPDILAGLRLALTVALIVSIVGEMIASQDGLGQAVLAAARSFRSAELFAGVVILGVIGFLSNALLASTERRLLRWQRT